MLLRTSIAADANCIPHFMTLIILPFETALSAHLQSLPTLTLSRISFRSGNVMPAFFANFWMVLKNFWACSIIFKPAIMLLLSRRPRTELASWPSSGLLKSISTFHLWMVCTRLMRSGSRARPGPSPPSSSSSRNSAGVTSSRSWRRAPMRGEKCSWSKASNADEGSLEAARPACNTSPTSRPSACNRGSLRPRMSSKIAFCCCASSWMASSCAGTSGCRLAISVLMFRKRAVTWANTSSLWSGLISPLPIFITLSVATSASSRLWKSWEAEIRAGGSSRATGCPKLVKARQAHAVNARRPSTVAARRFHMHCGICSLSESSVSCGVSTMNGFSSSMAHGTWSNRDIAVIVRLPTNRSNHCCIALTT
mmetsp:Transcript_91589/g.284938  ORF Transcript_91589/g.284938 Transcript_91589/m.284938 type:complete len:367 (+) Transcript_91589:339-1439(+)